MEKARRNKSSYWSMGKLTENFKVDFSPSRTAHFIVSSANVDARMMTRHILNDDRVPFNELISRRKNVVLKIQKERTLISILCM